MTTSATGSGAAGSAGAAGSYAGDVTPREAWEVLSSNPDAVLVDVRSAAEWTFVGLPDLRGLQKQPLLVAWQDFPGMTPNAGFLQSLQDEIPGRDAPVFFLCRSGGRSRSAAIAATAAGFAACFNVAGGFEGNLDEAAHRGQRDGWKAQGLPWVQS
ncbi:rhodanese-like domain-containing protein [Marinibaculum pumilum]|uniref:Rhodanese-like domain-containing protein n=1 Tax=Marinibaculum pumilum TaxID=1766165 RepID=A0ABV7L935_9PROT